jgi:site-specific DNA recombinase
LRAAIYARVSSQAQKDRHTIASQLTALREYVARQGWRLVAEFIDDGRTAKSGHLEKRGGLARLHAACARGELDVVAVVDVDRFTRSEKLRERGEVYGPLQEAGVKIGISSTGQLLDFDTDIGDLSLSIGNNQAASWLRKHRERIVRGKLEAVRRGKKPAGPTPFGYLYDRASGAWSVDPELGPVVAEAFGRVAAGETCAAVARDLAARAVPTARLSRSGKRRTGTWSGERLWQLVTKRTYLGEWVADKAKQLKVPVPRIVSDELWEAADQALRRCGLRGLNRVKHEYVVHGVAKCGLCRAELGCASAKSGAVDGRRHYYYTCTHRRRPPAGVMRCTLPMRRADDVDARVWRKIAELLTRPRVIEKALAKRAAAAGTEAKDWQQDLRGYERKLQQLERDEVTLMDRFRRRLVSQGAMDVALGQMAKERALLERQVESATRQAASQEARRSETEDLAGQLEDLRRRAAHATVAEQRGIVRALATEILVFADRIEVHVEIRTQPAFAQVRLAG